MFFAESVTSFQVFSRIPNSSNTSRSFSDMFSAVCRVLKTRHALKERECQETNKFCIQLTYLPSFKDFLTFVTGHQKCAVTPRKLSTLLFPLQQSQVMETLRAGFRASFICSPRLSDVFPIRSRILTRPGGLY